MENQRPPMESAKQDQELALPDMIKSEVNFLIFPFFALSRKGLREKFETEYREVIKRGDETLEILWNVSANPKYGYPGPFDRGLHKAIEQIISEILQEVGKVTNPIALGSLYELCKRMGMDSFGGRDYRKIKEALERVTTTSVKSKGAFYSKGRKQWIEDIFHLYERVVLKGWELPSGEIADTNYLFLGSRYLESLNAFYVKPLDYKYLRGLKSQISSRLYEILGIRFYGLQRRKQRCVWFDYDILCQLLPINPQRYYSKAKEKLEAAHTELMETDFLSSVKWQRKSKKKWIIRYYPGKRAEEELKKNYESSYYLPEESTITARAYKEPKNIQLKEEDKELVLQLTNHGISESSAERLVKEHAGRIPEKLEIFDWIKSHEAEKIRDDAAYLRRMIEENWSAPNGFESEKKKKVKLRALEGEYKQRVKKARIEAEEWSARPPEDRVVAPLNSWIWGEKQFNHHEPTEEEIEAKKIELIANLQTKEEYEQHLIDEIEKDIQSKKHRITG